MEIARSPHHPFAIALGTAQRNEEIFEARVAGESFPSIGARYGLGKVRARNIVVAEAKRRGVPMPEPVAKVETPT